MLKSIGFAALAFLTVAGTTDAELIVDLTGGPDDTTVNISLSGSVSADSAGSGYSVFAMDFPTNSFVYLSETPITGTTAVTNTTTQSSSSVTSILLGSSPGFQLLVSPQMVVYGGQSLLFSGSGTFDLPGGRTFSEFNVGTFWGDFITGGNLAGNGVTLNVGSPVNPVPEPSTLALLAVGLLGISGYATRKRRQR